MADGRKYIQTQKFYLAGGGISATDTSITLRSMVYPGGTTDVTMSELGTIAYGTLEPGTSREEIISFTGITQNSDDTAILTGVTRGLKFYSPYDQDTTLRKSHAGNAIFIITNNPQHYDGFANKNNDETITGQWLGPTPTDASQLATKQYVDDTVNGGAVSYEAVVIAGTAGETLAANEIVYLKVSDGRWYKTDADTTATFDKVMLGIAKGSGTAGNAITGGVHIKGVYSGITSGSNGAYCYLSNTAGAVSTTAGTVAFVIGQFKGASGLHFDPYFYRMLTADQIAAIAGTQGVPSSSNKFSTNDNNSQYSTDIVQSLGGTAIEFGVTDAISGKNKIAQSFIPTKTKIRGVRLARSTSTGVFTGTVTVAIQADSSGAPSGTNLAAVTITNQEWFMVKEGEETVGEINAIFTTEYSSLVVGNTYWIVITSSTSDSANHPNILRSSSNDYANGEIKYYNTTDGWTSFGGLDLVFWTFEGVKSQLVKSDTDGKIPKSFLDRDKMPIPMYDQSILMGATALNIVGVASNDNGSVLWIAYQSSANTVQVARFERNKAGRYIKTHPFTSIATNVATNYDCSLLYRGDYIYLFYQITGTNVLGVRRLLAADLTGATTMTVPATATTTGVHAWSNSVEAGTATTFFYVNIPTTSNVDEMSVSSTTLTTTRSGTATSTIYNIAQPAQSFNDGSNIFIVTSTSNGTVLIYKLADEFGAGISSTTSITSDDLNIGTSATTTVGNTFGFAVDSEMMYILIQDENVSAAAVKLYFTPYEKP